MITTVLPAVETCGSNRFNAASKRETTGRPYRFQAADRMTRLISVLCSVANTSFCCEPQSLV